MTHPLTPLWDRLGGPADTGPVDFPSLHAKARPNRFLMAPPGLCPDGDVDEAAPAFGTDVAALRDAFRVSVFAEPNAQFVGASEAQDRYVVRSRLMGFPDVVAAEFISLTSPFAEIDPEPAATLAVLSQSRIGHSDFGVNAARVRRIVRKLQARLPALTAR